MRADALFLCLLACLLAACDGRSAQSSPDLRSPGCLRDRDCPASAPRCYLLGEVCVPCLRENDSCPLGLTCNEGRFPYVCEPGCKRDEECPPSKRCANSASGAFQCIPGCRTTAECSLVAGTACCDGTCIDPKTDPMNCGACGVRCSVFCSEGACSTDFLSDLNNCGGLHQRCHLDFATPACQAGHCIIFACLPGHADCDKITYNGCEVATDADPRHCGDCNTQCTADHPGCTAGMCH